MDIRYESGDEPVIRDCRERPDRGVRIEPLPRGMHRAFTRFIVQYQSYAFSQLSTWKLARREHCDPKQVEYQIARWKAIINICNHMQWLGTTNDSASHSRRPGSHGRIDP